MEWLQSVPIFKTGSWCYLGTSIQELLILEHKGEVVWVPIPLQYANLWIDKVDETYSWRLQIYKSCKSNGQWLWLSWYSGCYLTPEVSGSNPVIGKIYAERLLWTLMK